MIDMRYLRYWTFFALLSCASLPLHAYTSVGPAGLPSAADFSASLLPDVSGVVSWKTLAQVEPVKRGGKMVPEFSKEILALDDQTVSVCGFMMPLNMTSQQRHFLLSAVPASCPFCMPAGPEAIVEVVSKRPVKFGFDPIIMSGKLSLLKNDQAGMLYRMTDAETVAMPAK
jgi:uncharacterized protein